MIQKDIKIIASYLLTSKGNLIDKGHYIDTQLINISYQKRFVILSINPQVNKFNSDF